MNYPAEEDTPKRRMAENIRKARAEAGLTQAQLAEAVGVTEQAVYYWESGESSPKGRNLDALSKSVGWTKSELRFGKGAPVVHGIFETGAEDSEDWQPNPRYRAEIPPRAYAVAMGYLDRLKRAGLKAEELEKAERLLMDRQADKRHKRVRRDYDEADWIDFIDANWAIVSEVLSWQGVRA